LKERRNYIVAYLLKDRTMEPVKEPLLANGSEKTYVCTQRPGVSCMEDSWKGAAIQRGLEPGSILIAVIKAVTKKRLVKALQAGKDLACAPVIC
jgi:hypothetical protein